MIILTTSTGRGDPSTQTVAVITTHFERILPFSSRACVRQPKGLQTSFGTTFRTLLDEVLLQKAQPDYNLDSIGSNYTWHQPARHSPSSSSNLSLHHEAAQLEPESVGHGEFLLDQSSFLLPEAIFAVEQTRNIFPRSGNMLSEGYCFFSLGLHSHHETRATRCC